jgi:hypothetical protein
MSAHFVKQRLQRKPEDISLPIPAAKPSRSTHTPIKHLDRPHAHDFERSASPGELFVMVLAMAFMITLVIWLGWIIVMGCMGYLREKVDDPSPNTQSRKQEHLERAGTFLYVFSILG